MKIPLLLLSLVVYCIDGRLVGRDALRRALLNSSAKPCTGHIVLVFESFNYLSDEEFDNQRRFFGQRLFTPDYFNNFDRLSIATREFDNLEIVANFSSMNSLSDLKHVMQSIEHYSNRYEPRSLEGALIDFAGHDYRSDPGIDDLTAVFFVSGTDGLELDYVGARIKDLQDQRIRVVFIANSDKADTQVLEQLVGDENLVFEYDAGEREPNDYQHWFSKIIGC